LTIESDVLPQEQERAMVAVLTVIPANEVLKGEQQKNTMSRETSRRRAQKHDHGLARGGYDPSPKDYFAGQFEPAGIERLDKENQVRHFLFDALQHET